jgi:hypothetical protein
MSYFRDFMYVDGHYQIENRPTRWKRMLLKDVKDQIVGPSGNKNCFTSIQRFQDAISLRDIRNEAKAKLRLVKDDDKPAAKVEEKTQLHYTGLFFDFDTKPEIYDGDREKAVGASQEDCVKVIAFFTQLGVEPQQMRCWFSGSKGFHLLVHPDCFAIKPHHQLTYIVKLLAMYLKEFLQLKSLDQSVYSIPRVWRIVDSIHQETGLHKIEFYSNHLHELTPAEIMKEARSPRGENKLWEGESAPDATPIPECVAFFNRFVKNYQDEIDLRNLRPHLPVIQTPDWPVCIKDVYQNGIKRPGSRNQVVLAFATYFKDVGMDAKTALDYIKEWDANISGGDQRKLSDRDANAKSVVNSVYADPDYRFACQFILATGQKPDKKVACVGMENCPTVNKNPRNQEPASIPNVSLHQVMSARYNGVPVKFAFHVSGKSQKTFIVPRVVTATCTPRPDTEMCQNCRNLKFLEGKTSEKNEEGIQARQRLEFDEKSRELLAMIQVSDEQKKGKLKHALGIPARCMAQKIVVESKTDIEELRLIPLVETTSSYDTAQPDLRGQADVGQQHVVVLAYALIGDACKSIKPNSKFYAMGIPYESPRDQTATVLIYESSPAQDDIGTFRMTPELHQKLKVFQVEKGQKVDAKFEDMHEDFEHNVHKIWGRRDVAIALDLSYHSVLSFRFQDQLIVKGWVELLIIGDSGNGKTKLVRSMLEHYRLGELTGAEGAKRTGLVWANVQVGGTMMLEWGKIPQNDGRLLVIDEFSGMSAEAIGELTRLRSEGIAESQGVNQQTTHARTRLVFLTNPRNGQALDTFTYGVLAISSLFDSHADTRRIDLAVGVRSDDIDTKIINQRYDKSKRVHKYVQDLCRNLILWAWSRREQHIVFEEEATIEALRQAGRLGDKYKSNVMLVTPADQREKIARLAVAAAARVYSTDDGTRIIVKKEHVTFVCNLIERCYDSKAIGLNEYAAATALSSAMSPDKEEKLRKEFKKFDEWEHVRQTLLATTYFRKGDLGDQLGYEPNQIKELIRWMNFNMLIQNTTSGFKKLPAFISMLKKLRPEKDDIGNDPPY